MTGGTLYRSVTFRGDHDDAERYRAELAAEYRARRSITKAAPMLTVSELLDRWLAADHPWKPSTLIGYRSNAKALQADIGLASARAVSLTPRLIRAAFARWSEEGAGPTVISGRFRVLRSAIWVGIRRTHHRHPSDQNDARSGTADSASPFGYRRPRPVARYC